MLELSTEIQGKVKEATDEMAANFMDIYRLIFPDGSTEREDNELFGMIMTSFLNSVDEFRKQAMKES